MADTIINLNPIGGSGSGTANSGQLTYWTSATTIGGASGITVTNSANSSSVGFGLAPLVSHPLNFDTTSYGHKVLICTDPALGKSTTLNQRTSATGMTFGSTTDAFTLSIFRNQSLGGGGGVLGYLEWEGIDTLGASYAGGLIESNTLDDTAGSIDTEMLFNAWVAGVNLTPFHLQPTPTVIARFYNPAAPYPTNWEAIEVRYDSNLARIFSTKTGGGTEREFQIGTSTSPWGFTTAAFYPTSDVSFDLGTTSKRVRNAYVGTRLVVGNATSQAGLIWVRTAGGINAFTIDDTTGVATHGATVVTVASASGAAGFNMPHGSAPSAPVNGDMWTTTGGLFVRINGTTKTVTLT